MEVGDLVKTSGRSHFWSFEGLGIITKIMTRPSSYEQYGIVEVWFKDDKFQCMSTKWLVKVGEENESIFSDAHECA